MNRKQNVDMKICSVKDELELSQDSVIIRRRGVGNALAAGLNGERSIPISTITAIQVKMGGWTPGYILFSYAGSKPFRGGLIEATQDPDAFIFEKRLNNDVALFKEKVEELRRAAIEGTGRSTEQSLGDELMKLVKLRDAGVLSNAEFEIAKKKLLGS